MRRGRVGLLCALLAGLLAVPSVALADAAFPVAIFAVPGLAVLFVPVVLLEAYVLTAMLKERYRRSLLVSLVMNLVSALVGVPLGWFGVVYLQGVFPVLGPPGVGDPFAGWPAVATGLGVELLAFLAVSIVVEFLIALLMLRGRPKTRLFAAVVVGNVLSYVLLAGSIVAMWALQR